MTRAEIKSDPWKARQEVVKNLNNAIDDIENIYISEDGMEEDAEYRKEMVSRLAKYLKDTTKLTENIKLDEGGYV